jgi:hypothetical protein
MGLGVPQLLLLMSTSTASGGKHLKFNYTYSSMVFILHESFQNMKAKKVLEISCMVDM